MRLLDTDNDGTVDFEEAKKAASTLFDKLDRDHDGTLDRRELGGRFRLTISIRDAFFRLTIKGVGWDPALRK